MEKFLATCAQKNVVWEFLFLSTDFNFVLLREIYIEWFSDFACERLWILHSKKCDMCHPSLKKTIIRSSYNIHCQIICEVVIEVVIVLTFSFSKKAFVRAFSLKMPNDINPKF